MEYTENRLYPLSFSPAEVTQVHGVLYDPGFIYELKYDGFRAIAYIESGVCRLVSRRGNVYKSFAPLRESLAALDRTTVLDGEIVVLDGAGRPQFYDLLRRRGRPVFYAFDCLALDGRDLRARPLLERKRILAKLVKDRPGVLYAQHYAGDKGADLFRLVCERTSRESSLSGRTAPMAMAGSRSVIPNTPSTKAGVNCSRSGAKRIYNCDSRGSERVCGWRQSEVRRHP